MIERSAKEGRRNIVEVRDIDGETALCPAEAVLREVEGENQWLLYPAALLDEGKYVLTSGARTGRCCCVEPSRRHLQRW